jgi:hypothetical protein
MVVGQIAIQRRQPRPSNFGRAEAAWRDYTEIVVVDSREESTRPADAY